MSDIRVVTLADVKYFGYLQSLVKSINLNLPGVKIHAYLVNLDDAHGKILQGFHPNLEYTIENVKFKFNLQTKCYCTNRRSYLLHDLRQKTNDILVWMDADSIVVKKCPDFLEFVKTCDVSFRPKNLSDLTPMARKKRQKPSGFMAGVIVVGNTENSLKFTSAYNSMLSQSNYVKARINYSGPIAKLPKKIKEIWMANQNILRNVYKSVFNEINFVPLPQRYLDCSFTKDTAIWSVKASNRKDKKFAKMFKKYGG